MKTILILLMYFIPISVNQVNAQVNNQLNCDVEVTFYCVPADDPSSCTPICSTSVCIPPNTSNVPFPSTCAADCGAWNWVTVSITDPSCTTCSSIAAAQLSGSCASYTFSPGPVPITNNCGCGSSFIDLNNTSTTLTIN